MPANKISEIPFEHMSGIIEAALLTAPSPESQDVNLAMAMHDPDFQLAFLVGNSAVADLRDGVTLMPISWHRDAFEVSGAERSARNFDIIQKASTAVGSKLFELGYIQSGRMYQ